MPLSQLAARVRNGLWFIPGVWVAGATAAALTLVWVDSATPDLADRLPLVFGGGPDGARGLLAAIAGSMITVAATTFSITIVALQLASSQFSPRVLRTYMRDRLNQSVLGTLIGTFFYALLVLRSIRGEENGAGAFVPALAVTGAIVLAGVAVVMLVYFIHHISSGIQVSSIVAAIAGETVAALESTWPPPPGAEGGQPEEAPIPQEAPLPQAAPTAVPAAGSGYLQEVDTRALVELAHRLDIIVRVERRPGEWVQEGAALFAVWPPAAGSRTLADDLNRRVTVGAQRSLDQDAAFGIRQLVDVGVKALSPGINDPTSARDCINRVTQILVAAAQRGEPAVQHRDQDGRMRLVLERHGFADLVALAFDELRHHGHTIPVVALALAEGIATVASLAPPARRGALTQQARLLLDATSALPQEADRRRVRAALGRAARVNAPEGAAGC